MEYNKDVLQEVDNIIRDNAILPDSEGTFSISDICEDDQKKLVALMLKQSQLWGEDFEAITENRDDRVVHEAFIHMLQDSTTKNKVFFADILTKCLLCYYRKRLDSLIDERLQILNVAAYEDKGFTQTIDNQTGEAVWMRGFAS